MLGYLNLDLQEWLPYILNILIQKTRLSFLSALNIYRSIHATRYKMPLLLVFSADTDRNLLSSNRGFR
jgi:hypothetical protein